jgi:hypothetical protein
MNVNEIIVGRNPNEPLGPECEHKVTEDCLVCAICGLCRESLNEEDICVECGETQEC